MLELSKNYDIIIETNGGGISGQSQAILKFKQLKQKIF
jgi:ribosomal protein S9